MVYELEPEYDRLSMKNLSRGMKGTIAEYYSDWASETTRDKMLYMARVEQRRTGGPSPSAWPSTRARNTFRTPTGSRPSWRSSGATSPGTPRGPSPAG